MQISSKSTALLSLLGIFLSAGPVLSQRIWNPAAKGPQTIPYEADGDNPPKLIFRLEPRYPVPAEVARIEAAVTMRIIINEEGQVWSAEILKGHQLLNQAALDAMIRWHYAPTVIEGKVVPVITAVKVQFSPVKVMHDPDEKSSTGIAAPKREPIRTSGAYLENRIIRRVEPEYPPLARANDISGTVILRVIINEEGEVYEVKVVRGHPLLQQAAVDAVRQWKFKPTLMNGEPVPVLGTIAVSFNLR
jgi:TonB family protein